MTEKFTVEQDSSLQAAQAQHARELQHLQQTHQQQILALTSELETKHQARLAELRASLESEQQARFEAHVAELQTKHATEISALELKHSSNLDTLESCCLSEIQSIRDEHRRTLELLRADFEDQLRRKDSAHHASLAQELEKLQRRHDEELRSAQESLGAESSSGRACPASELPAAQQVSCCPHTHKQLLGRVFMVPVSPSACLSVCVCMCAAASLSPACLQPIDSRSTHCSVCSGLVHGHVLEDSGLVGAKWPQGLFQ